MSDANTNQFRSNHSRDWFDFDVTKFKSNTLCVRKPFEYSYRLCAVFDISRHNWLYWELRVRTLKSSQRDLYLSQKQIFKFVKINFSETLLFMTWLRNIWTILKLRLIRWHSGYGRQLKPSKQYTIYASNYFNYSFDYNNVWLRILPFIWLCLHSNWFIFAQINAWIGSNECTESEIHCANALTSFMVLIALNLFMA